MSSVQCFHAIAYQDPYGLLCMLRACFVLCSLLLSIFSIVLCLRICCLHLSIYVYPSLPLYNLGDSPVAPLLPRGPDQIAVNRFHVLPYNNQT